MNFTFEIYRTLFRFVASIHLHVNTIEFFLLVHRKNRTDHLFLMKKIFIILLCSSEKQFLIFFSLFLFCLVNSFFSSYCRNEVHKFSKIESASPNGSIKKLFCILFLFVYNTFKMKSRFYMI